MEPRSQMFTRWALKAGTFCIVLYATSLVLQFTQWLIPDQDKGPFSGQINYLVAVGFFSVLLWVAWTILWSVSRTEVHLLSLFISVTVPPVLCDSALSLAESSFDASGQYPDLRGDLLISLLPSLYVFSYVVLSNGLMRVSLPASELWPRGSAGGTKKITKMFAKFLGFWLWISIWTTASNNLPNTDAGGDSTRRDFAFMLAAIPIGFVYYGFLRWFLPEIIQKINPMPTPGSADVDRKDNTIPKPTSAEQTLPI